MWTQAKAIELAIKIEAICPGFGAHVALTGGCLYKDGERKDCDFLFYRIRQEEFTEERQSALFDALGSIGVYRYRGAGWVHKAFYQGLSIDMFFPENLDDETEHYDSRQWIDTEAQLEVKEYARQLSITNPDGIYQTAWVLQRDACRKLTETVEEIAPLLDDEDIKF